MKKPLFCIFFVFLIFITSVMGAEEQADWQIYGLDADNVISFASSILAAILFILTLAAYRRDGRKKFMWVSAAFLLYAIKGVLLASDIFIASKGAWVDPVANLLDFGVLLCFFAGIIRK